MTAAQTEDDAMRVVLALDAARADAMVRGDVAMLDALTHDEYTHVESSGRTGDKASFLATFADAAVTFDHFVIDANRVRIFGDTAVVSGRYHNAIRTVDGVQPTKYAHHLRVYVRCEGRWQNIAHQATESRR